MSSIDVQCLGVFFLKTPANNHQWPFESQQSMFNVLKVLLCTFRACRQLLRIFFFFFFFHIAHKDLNCEVMFAPNVFVFLPDWISPKSTAPL